jgi:3-deoxy-manno-octulosonate cytidylyltransferase (CMP-KDO synthetase)
MNVVGVIPARYASTRFPGKPICPILGKPMIQWVYERASLARGLDAVLVATDDERIEHAVRLFGGEVVMTSPSCPSGSDRVWLAVRDKPVSLILNIQGDEPTLEPASLEALLDLMASHSKLGLGTLVSPIRSQKDFRNPNVVKVALGEGGRCLYFSRSPIPFLRGRQPKVEQVFRHVGLYAFRRDLLEAFTSWPPSKLETTEGLEQLRALEHGVEVRAAVVEWPGCAVDAPEDVAVAEAMLLRQASSRGVRPRSKGRSET